MDAFQERVLRARWEQARVGRLAYAGTDLEAQNRAAVTYLEIQDELRGRDYCWPYGYDGPVEWGGTCPACGRGDGTHQASCIHAGH